MMQSSAFGVTKPEEFYAKYVAQGCWARCLQCQKEANAPFTDPTKSFSERSRSAPSSGLACRISSDNASKKPWKESLECNSHGCSRCLHTFPEDHWTKTVLEDHKKPSKQMKLVCKECVSIGFAPGKLTPHSCEGCKRELGSLMFAKHILDHSQNRTGSKAGSKAIC